MTGRTLDEYELTDHYGRWREDLALMAELEVPAARYGVPWHRIQPAPGRWDWRHADEPLERLLELGIAPQVDLVHYGLPGWIEGAYLHPDYPSAGRRVRRAARRALQGAHPLVHAAERAAHHRLVLRPDRLVAAVSSEAGAASSP